MSATKKTTTAKPAKSVATPAKPAKSVDAAAKTTVPVDAATKPAKSVDVAAKTTVPVDAATKPAKPVEAVVKPAKPVDTVVTASKATADPLVKASAEVATKSVEKAVEVTREQVAVAGNDVLKAYEDAVTYGKDNFDAVLKANDVFSKGLQEINKVLFASVQSSFEDSASVSKKFFACTSVQEVVDLQNKLVQSTYTKAVDQSKKITDMSVKVTEETAGPLSRRLNVTVEKIAKPLAA